LVSHKGSVTVRPSDTGETETIIAARPSKEAIRGTTVLFRQLASAEEPVSYDNVRKLIGRRIHELAEARQEERKEYQRRWNRAHRQLNARSLVAMADRKALQEMGGHPSLPVPGEDDKPQELLSLFQYGDLIHWGRHAGALKTLTGDDLSYNYAVMSFLQAMIQLSHFYLGYSLLIRRAVTDS